MKIQFVLPDVSIKPIGGYKIVYEYASWMADNLPNWDVEILHLRTLPQELNGQLLYALRTLDWRFAAFPKWAAVSPRVRFKRCASFPPNGSPDVRVATAWRTAERISRIPAERGESRYYFIQHLEDWGCDRRRVFQTWRDIKRKIFVARWLRDVAIENDIDVTKSRHVPNGIGPEYFLGARVPKIDACVAFMYSAQSFKGGALGLEVLDAIARANPHASFRVFGTGSRPAHLPRRTTYFRNPGREQLVREIYGPAEIFLSTSSLEGWGLPGAEAMAAHCALISTDHRGVNDYATHDESALISAPEDAAALVRHIQLCLNDSALKERIADTGYRRISEMTSEVAARNFLDAVLANRSH